MEEAKLAMGMDWSGAVTSIGVVHSPFLEATGTPVQNYAARGHEGGPAELVAMPEGPVVDVRGGRGTLEIVARWEGALADLEGCDRIWVLFWTHRAATAQAKVIPYRDTAERGLFSTRAPARPNPIGLSCVKVLGVVGRFVHVSEIDMLDGTPILDIKPYVPNYDSFPEARCAWLDEKSVRHGVVQADARFERGAGLERGAGVELRPGAI
jgi:tRNA-Thr(GGU) m(6)t(6)A37 methyltransferase TsaA